MSSPRLTSASHREPVACSGPANRIPLHHLAKGADLTTQLRQLALDTTALNPQL